MADDATNYMINLGKPVEEKIYFLSLSHKELKALKALAQNPHSYYQDSKELMEVSRNIFEETKYMLEKSERYTITEDDGINF